MSGRVNSASATKMLDPGSIPGWAKKLLKLVVTASLIDVQYYKGQCEASNGCRRHVDMW